MNAAGMDPAAALCVAFVVAVALLYVGAHVWLAVGLFAAALRGRFERIRAALRVRRESRRIAGNILAAHWRRVRQESQP